MISLILGCMFSGKSSELAKRIRRAQRAGYVVVVAKHVWDTRYSLDGEIVTHDKEGRLEAFQVSTIAELANYLPKAAAPGPPQRHWLFVDEAQFIQGDWNEFCIALAQAGWNVTLAALNCDSKGIVYPAIGAIVADRVKMLKAVCSKCKGDAVYSQCMQPEKLEKGILIGGAESWEARCRACFGK